MKKLLIIILLSLSGCIVVMKSDKDNKKNSIKHPVYNTQIVRIKYVPVFETLEHKPNYNR